MTCNGTRVVLLSIDALRRDRAHHLKTASEELRNDFAEFHAISHGIATPLSFPGLFSGTLPRGNGELPRERQTLAESADSISVGFSNNGHLGTARGYDRGFDAFGSLVPPGHESVLDRLRGIDWLRNNRLAQSVYQNLISIYRDSSQYEGDSKVPIPYRTAPAVVEFLENYLQNDSTGFIWGHFMDPHAPYHPDTATGNVPRIVGKELQSLTNRVYSFDAAQLTSEELRIVREIYDGNVRYAASHLGKLLRWSAEQPWYEESFIVITGDHGELLGEHGQLTHPWDTVPYDELVEVPLFVKFPGFEHAGESFSKPVSHIDVHRVLRAVFDQSAEAALLDVLLEGENDPIVSLSNTTIRVTTTDGAVFRDIDGNEWATEGAEKSVAEELRTIPFPQCNTHSGEVPGVDYNRVEEQLAALGYK